MLSVTEIENAEVKQETIYSDCREELCEDIPMDDFTSRSLMLNVNTEQEELNESDENSAMEHFVMPVITKVETESLLNNNEDIVANKECHKEDSFMNIASKSNFNVAEVSTNNMSSVILNHVEQTGQGELQEEISPVVGDIYMSDITRTGQVEIKDETSAYDDNITIEECCIIKQIQSRGKDLIRGSIVKQRKKLNKHVPNTCTEDCSVVNPSTSEARRPHTRRETRRLLLKDISNMPVGLESLEMPFYPKRRRTWQLSNVAPASPPLPPAPSTSPSQQCDVEVHEAPESLVEPSNISPSCSVPSPTMLIECKETSSLASSSIRNPTSPRHLRDEDTEYLINFGSDSGSDESDDEDMIYPALPVPRVFRSTLETPLDSDEAGDVDTAGEPAIAGSSSPTTVPPIMTTQPWRWYDFVWKTMPNTVIPPESRRERFSQKNVGPSTPSVDPYNIFVEIWDRQIMEHIVLETNKYAQQLASQMMSNHSLRPTSRISQWRDTTVDELYVYFGIVLAMGIVLKSGLEEYWRNTPDIFYTPGFSAHMSINRFLLLSKCLHFNNNEDMCVLELNSSEAKLYKIQPILSHLNNKFQSMYIPSQNIALDESLLQWKGCLDIGQLIPNKMAHRGVKTYEICESQTGYLWRFEVHAHKKSPPQQFEDPLDASTPSIVLRLVRGLENKGYTLWMDNFYNSPCLARRLKSLGFDCVGTLRTDRKFVPQFLHGLTKQNMRIGQIAGLTSGDVDVMVWRHSNRVAMISTYHGNAQQTHGGSTKPTLIYDYNIMMGGVDKKDQMLAMYPIERQRTKVWYKKLFRRLLNVSVLNSFIIQRRRTSLEHRTFRISLIKSLLARHSAASLAPAPKQKPVDITHRLAEYPFINAQRKRRVCVSCKKRVHTYCVGCSKTVCIEPCFVTIHS